MLLVAAVAMAPLLGLAVLTGLGSRRRGAGPVVVLLSAAFFPVAWVAWYLSDVHLDGRRHVSG